MSDYSTSVSPSPLGSPESQPIAESTESIERDAVSDEVSRHSSFSVVMPSQEKETMLQNFFRRCSEMFSAVRNFFWRGFSTSYEPLTGRGITINPSPQAEEEKLTVAKVELEKQFPNNHAMIEAFAREHFRGRKMNQGSVASYQELCEIGCKMRAGGAISEELASSNGYEQCRQYSMERSSIIHQAHVQEVPWDEAKKLFGDRFEPEEKIAGWHAAADKKGAQQQIQDRTKAIKQAWLASGSESAKRFQFKEKVISNAVIIASVNTYSLPEAAARKIFEEFLHFHGEVMLDETQNRALLEAYDEECKKYSLLQKKIVEVMLECTGLTLEEAQETLAQFIRSQEKVPVCEDLERYCKQWKDYQTGRNTAVLTCHSSVFSSNEKMKIKEIFQAFFQAFDQEFAHIRPRLPRAATIASWRKKEIASWRKKEIAANVLDGPMKQDLPRLEVNPFLQ